MILMAPSGAMIATAAPASAGFVEVRAPFQNPAGWPGTGVGEDSGARSPPPPPPPQPTMAKPEAKSRAPKASEEQRRHDFLDTYPYLLLGMWISGRWTAAAWLTVSGTLGDGVH